MTTLVIWLSRQNQNPSAMTIASDSRLSYGPNSTWDFGRKIFACQNSADVFGYAGDSTLGANLLSQIATAVDTSNLWWMPATQRRLECEKMMASATSGYFKELSHGLSIIHCFYDPTRGFVSWRSEFDRSHCRWSHNEMHPESGSNSDNALSIGVFGSGQSHFKNRLIERLSKNAGVRYSRTYFKTLRDVIDECDDPLTGGPIQISSIGSQGAAKPAIFLRGQERFMFGTQVDPAILTAELECWNEHGEFVNPVTGELRSGATPRAD